MDIKYLTMAIIGFVIGLSINIVGELSENDLEGAEALPHVKRYQALMDFEKQRVDEPWAKELELHFKQVFEQSSNFEISYIKCFTDICSLSLTEANIGLIEAREELTLLRESLKSPVFESFIEGRFDLSPSGEIYIFQYERKSI